MIGIVSARSTGGGAVRTAALFLVSFLLTSCVLERRGDEAVQPDSLTSDAIPDSLTADERARHAVRIFRDAVAAGDISRALSLMSEGASIIDPLVGRTSDEAPVGEVLLELRRIHSDGVRLESIEDEVSLLPSGDALVLTTLAVLQEVEGVGEEVDRMEESALLTPSPEGWKLRHLHRSLVEPAP